MRKFSFLLAAVLLFVSTIPDVHAQWLGNDSGSSVDPHEQIAFYDPGLGSQADGGHVFGRLLRWIHNTVAQATGFGITRNIIDCYAALIQLWQPGAFS